MRSRKTAHLHERANFRGSLTAELGPGPPFFSPFFDVFSSPLEHISKRKKLLHRPCGARTSLNLPMQAQLFMERNHGDSENDSDGLKISSNDDISEENIVQSGKRRSAVDAKTQVRQLSPDIEDEDDPRACCFKRAAEGFKRPPDIDVDWQLPPLAKRKLREKPKTVTLTLPAKEIPTLLASTSTVTKTSTRHELKLVSTMLVSGGADLNNVSLSKSTIYRQRKSTVTSAATGIREKIKSYAFSDSQHKFFVLHWDGKIIQYINGTTEERLAIALSAPNFIPGQFLAAPVIANGKGQWPTVSMRSPLSTDS